MIIRMVIMIVGLVAPSAPYPRKAGVAMRPISGRPDEIDSGTSRRHLHYGRGRHRPRIVDRRGRCYDRDWSDYHRRGYPNAETKSDTCASRID